MRILIAILALTLVALGVDRLHDPPQAAVAQGTTVYAEFGSEEARGVVEIVGFGKPNAVVTARMLSPDSGVVGFCVVQFHELLGCQSRSSQVAGFARDEQGCVSFDITFSEPITHVGILNEDFWLVFDLAPLTSAPPKGLGMLHKCR